MGYARLWVESFRGNGPPTTLDRHLMSWSGYRPLESAKEMVSLAGKVLRIVFTSVGWWREAVIESARIFRVASLPLYFSTIFYMVAFASFLLGNVVYQLGAGDRFGPAMYLGMLREVSAWVPFMLLVAIVGAGMAGDIGSRRIREELDALDVLGVDKLKTLVVPRVVAVTFAGLVLCLLNTLIVIAAILIANTQTIDQPIVPNIHGILLAMNHYDLISAILKAIVIGFFIGIVACQKGLSARGGAEGVGRAVSQAVVVTFLGLWLINTVWNQAFFTLFPDALGLAG